MWYIKLENLNIKERGERMLINNVDQVDQFKVLNREEFEGMLEWKTFEGCKVLLKKISDVELIEKIYKQMISLMNKDCSEIQLFNDGLFRGDLLSKAFIDGYKEINFLVKNLPNNDELGKMFVEKIFSRSLCAERLEVVFNVCVLSIENSYINRYSLSILKKRNMGYYECKELLKNVVCGTNLEKFLLKNMIGKLDGHFQDYYLWLWNRLPIDRDLMDLYLMQVSLFFKEHKQWRFMYDESLLGSELEDKAFRGLMVTSNTLKEYLYLWFCSFGNEELDEMILKKIALKLFIFSKRSMVLKKILLVLRRYNRLFVNKENIENYLQVIKRTDLNNPLKLYCLNKLCKINTFDVRPLINFLEIKNSVVFKRLFVKKLFKQKILFEDAMFLINNFDLGEELKESLVEFMVTKADSIKDWFLTWVNTKGYSQRNFVMGEAIFWSEKNLTVSYRRYADIEKKKNELLSSFSERQNFHKENK